MIADHADERMSYAVAHPCRCVVSDALWGGAGPAQARPHENAYDDLRAVVHDNARCRG
jgi:hypothetical protein